MTIPDPPPPMQRLTRAVANRLRPGDLGVVAARAGVGKTACLVQIALAELWTEHPVVHVALDAPVRDIHTWYERVLADALRQGYFPEGTSLADLRLDLEGRRHIHSYLQQGFTAARLDDALTLMADVMDFHPRTVVLDGFPFELARQEALTDLRQLASERGFGLWLSALTHRHETDNGQTGLPRVLAPFEDLLDVVFQLTPERSKVILHLLRDRHGTEPSDPCLALDPATFLITAE